MQARISLTKKNLASLSLLTLSVLKRTNKHLFFLYFPCIGNLLVLRKVNPVDPVYSTPLQSSLIFSRSHDLWFFLQTVPTLSFVFLLTEHHSIDKLWPKTKTKIKSFISSARSSLCHNGMTAQIQQKHSFSPMLECPCQALMLWYFE